MQAVAATLPGVESGLVGFEDVSGKVTDSEESYEAVEQAAASDLTRRIASGLAIFGLFLGSLVLGGGWFTAFVILVMVVAVGEFYANLRTRGYRPIALFGIIGVVMIGVGAHNWGVAAIGGWAGVVALATILFFSLTPRRDPIENLSVTILGVAWVGMLSFAILVANGPHPVAYIVFVVLLIALNDIGAFFVGRAFGRLKLAPQVSPKKDHRRLYRRSDRYWRDGVDLGHFPALGIDRTGQGSGGRGGDRVVLSPSAISLNPW